MSPRLAVLAAVSAPSPSRPPSCPGSRRACIPPPPAPQRWLVCAVPAPPTRCIAATPAPGGILRPSPPRPGVAVRAALARATPTSRAPPPSAAAGPTARPCPLVPCPAGGPFPPILPGLALARPLACVPGGLAIVLSSTAHCCPGACDLTVVWG